LETPIKADDNIKVIPAVNGKNAQAFLKDFIDNNTVKTIYIDGNKMEIKPFGVINGVIANENQEIFNDDEVYIYEVDNFKDLCKYMDIDLNEQVAYVNGKFAKDDTPVNDGAVIEIKSIRQEESKPEKSEEKIIEDKENKTQPAAEKTDKALSETESNTQLSDYSKEENKPLTQSDKFINSIMTNSSEIQVIVNGEPVVLDGKKSGYVFIDIFNYIDFDLSTPKGLIVLLLNGRKAEYTEPLRSGDVIEIKWE